MSRYRLLLGAGDTAEWFGADGLAAARGFESATHRVVVAYSPLGGDGARIYGAGGAWFEATASRRRLEVRPVGDGFEVAGLFGGRPAGCACGPILYAHRAPAGICEGGPA